MLKPDKIIKSLKHQKSTLPSSLNMLCWNVAKMSLKKDFQDYLKDVIKKEKINLLLLQEIKVKENTEEIFEHFSYIISPNMQTKKHLYGVLTAFNIACCADKKVLSTKKELSLLTHKSSLFTIHNIWGNKKLLIVNIHAVNFVSYMNFKKELDYIEKEISSFQGDLIVAGDFNTWSKKRIKALNNFAKVLSLKEVDFKGLSIKKIFGKHLDHIFYRGVKVGFSKVIQDDTFSDHNPMIVKFLPQI